MAGGNSQMWTCDFTRALQFLQPAEFHSLAEMSEYKVKFEVFEGPLDLLLYLIKKEEVDIYEVNLTKLATQFIEFDFVFGHFSQRMEFCWLKEL